MSDIRLGDILITSELNNRASRAPDFAAENKALVSLVAALAKSPESALQSLVYAALELTGAGSAGISVNEQVDGEDVFRWRATAGAFGPLVGATLPRNFSPCGVVVDVNAIQLMGYPQRYYPYIEKIEPPCVEVLLVPFYIDQSPVGTVWVVSHTGEKRFDREDARLVTSLSQLASAAFQNQSAVGEARDVAEDRRQLSARFEQQSRVFSTTLNSISDFTYAFDRDGRFLFANKPLLDLWGLTLEQAVGKNFFDLQYESSLAAKLQQQIEQVYTTGQRLTDETKYVSPSGQDGYYEYIFIPVLTADGSVECVVGSTRDITDRKRLELEREQLLASERAARSEAERAGRIKDEFLATLSHELRTPLSAIMGWARILQTNSSDAKMVTQGLETIERNAKAQNQIIEDLLDMSRIISGKVRLDVQRLDLAAVVHAAIDTVRPAADAKGIRIQPVLDAFAGPVSGDPNRLQQVFWNLLSNAIKFTPRDGRVQVVLQRVNSHLEIAVIDSGEGIKPEFLPYVFDRFRQADSTTTRQHGGLGLGLAIVKQLVELHGGTIAVKSGGKGLGCTFTVGLQLSATTRDPTGNGDGLHGTLTEQAAARIAGVKVLVVDDEPDARALIQRFLEDCEADVLIADCANDAIEQVRQHRPQMIISDIGMPGEDGFSLIKKLRALSPAEGGLTPAIALTAYARSEDRTRALLAGFDMHVSKPVEPSELIAIVMSLAGRTVRQNA